VLDKDSAFSYTSIQRNNKGGVVMGGHHSVGFDYHSEKTAPLSVEFPTAMNK
jgi:hypothetical protein